MTEAKPFTMEVKDIFSFKNGRTVIVGNVENGPSYLPPGEVEVLADGERIALLRIEGEMLSGAGEIPRGAGYRAVSTDATRCFDRDFLKRKRLDLKSRARVPEERR